MTKIRFALQDQYYPEEYARKKFGLCGGDLEHWAKRVACTPAELAEALLDANLSRDDADALVVKGSNRTELLAMKTKLEKVQKHYAKLDAKVQGELGKWGFNDGQTFDCPLERMIRAIEFVIEGRRFYFPESKPPNAGVQFAVRRLIMFLKSKNCRELGANYDPETDEPKNTGSQFLAWAIGVIGITNINLKGYHQRALREVRAFRNA